MESLVRSIGIVPVEGYMWSDQEPIDKSRESIDGTDRNN
jgi:hypothetical protein